MTLTTQELLDRVATVLPSGTYSYITFWRDARKLNLRPVGKFRQNPQMWPDAAAQKIIAARTQHAGKRG